MCASTPAFVNCRCHRKWKPKGHAAVAAVASVTFPGHLVGCAKFVREALLSATPVIFTMAAPVALGAAEKEEIRKAWSIFDKNGDGKIDKKVRGAFFQGLTEVVSERRLFRHLPRQELKDIMKVLSGGVEFKEFELQEMWETLDQNRVRAFK